MKMQQYLVLTLALVFFSACGQKKESAQQTPEPQKIETAAPGPVTPADQAKADAAKAEADKKAKEGRGSMTRNRAAKNKKIAVKKTGKDKSADKSTGKSTTNKKSVKSTDSIVSTDELQLTGGESKSGMIYTGSNADFIITKLLAEEQVKLADEQNRNAVLAANVWAMSYVIDSSAQLWIDIEFKKGNGLSKVQVKTAYKSGAAMQVQANTGSATSMDITADCLDTNLMANSCANLLVTFTQDGAQATALLRQTLANVWFEYEKVQEANEYATLVEFFKNAKLDIETPNKIDLAYLNTFEVVNGKSGFKAVIVGKKNQIIAFEADLLLKSDLSAPMIPVIKDTKFNALDLWMGRLPSKDLAFTHAISDARLVQNNTKGQITIDMMVNSASSGSKNAFTLKFTRISVAAEL